MVSCCEVVEIVRANDPRAIRQPAMKEVYKETLKASLRDKLVEIYGLDLEKRFLIELDTSQEDAEGNVCKIPSVLVEFV